jgi:hypothetical protein
VLVALSPYIKSGHIHFFQKYCGSHGLHPSLDEGFRVMLFANYSADQAAKIQVNSKSLGLHRFYFETGRPSWLQRKS